MADRKVCDMCNLPIATDEDFERYEGGDGEDLCWSEYYGTEGHSIVVDWMERALKAEGKNRKLKKENTALILSNKLLNSLLIRNSNAINFLLFSNDMFEKCKLVMKKAIKEKKRIGKSFEFDSEFIDMAYDNNKYKAKCLSCDLPLATDEDFERSKNENIVDVCFRMFSESGECQSDTVSWRNRAFDSEKRIEKLKKGIEVFMEAWSPHLPESWRKHFEELIGPVFCGSRDLE